MKGALFDLDGVIADTSRYHFLAWKNLIKKNFNCDLPDSLEKHLKGVSREDSLSIILEYLDINPDISSIDFKKLTIEKNNSYIHFLDNLNEEDILPGISKLLSDLKQNNIKIALASSSRSGSTVLKKLKIIDIFDTIIDPTSIAKGKPAPDIFVSAAKSIKVSPNECIGIEDSIAGISAINDSGAFSIAIGGKELSKAKIRFNTSAKINYSDILSSWKKFNS